MKTKIKTKRRIAFCGVGAVLILTVLVNFVLSKYGASAAIIEKDLTDRAPSNSYKLTPKIIGTWAMPKDCKNGSGATVNCTSAQSFAINGTDYIVIMAPEGGNDDHKGKNRVVAINRGTKNDRKVDLRNLGHGNGATWDSKNKQLLVVDETNVFRFNENYEYIDTKSTLNASGTAINASGIAYDNLHGQYWTSSGSYIRKVNMDTWKVSNIAKTKHTQVNQDLGYYHGYVYRPLWAGNTGDYVGRNGNFGTDDGVIMQFGDDGTFTGAYYTTSPSCELESVAFAGEEMYLLYNNCKDGTRTKGYYTIAKVDDEAQLKTMYHSFNVKYDANGGTGAPASYKTHVGISSKLSTTKPTRANYTFLGWSTSKTATKASYAAGATYLRKYSTIDAEGSTSKPVAEKDVTLYAVWQEQTYTVNYNANGGTGAPASQTIGKTKDATIPSSVPTRTNYKFLGWSTSKTATTASYYPSGKYTGRADVTLYAVWAADTYRVSYNATGGTGAPAAQTSALTENLTISNTVPTRTYFDFLGWATSAGGPVVYHPGDTYTGRANVTLYAVWSAQLYTISFNANGGTGAPTAMKVARIVSSVPIPATKPTRSGYIFRGWATSASATTAEYNIGDNYTGRSDITLYAVWEDNSSTPVTTIEINYDANGGTNAPETTVAEPGNITLSSSAPKRDGYTFLGWATSADATEAAYQPGDSAQFNSDTLLYAVWAKGTVTLSYDANGGTNAPEAHSGAIGEITIAATVPTREGYIFDGWAIDVSESASYQPGDLYRGSVSRKLYAVWTEQNLKIEYHLRGGSNGPADQSVAPKRRATISDTQPTRRAHYFRGWSRDEEATSVDYDPGDSIYVSTSNISLYAVWGASYYTVSFDVNGGSDDSFDDLVGEGDDVVIYEQEPTWDGYIFKGWDEDPEATTASYQPGDTIGSETDITLYAVWEKDDYGVDPDGDDDTSGDYDNTDYDDPSNESGTNNPKTSVSSIIGPISILPIGLISFITVALRRRRS